MDTQSQPIYNPDAPLTPGEQGWIEQTNFKILQALQFKGGLPVLAATPTYTGLQGELVETDNGTTRQICCYMNGTWRCFSGGVAFTELFTSSAGSGSAAWVDWDISSIVPSNTQYVEVLVRNEAGTTQTGGVRKNGSALDRKLSMPSNSAGTFTATVEVDSSRIIERYSSDVSIVFYILGYWK